MKRSGVYSMNSSSNYNPSNSYAYSNLNRKPQSSYGDVEDGRINETNRNIYEDENNERLGDLGSQVSIM